MKTAMKSRFLERLVSFAAISACVWLAAGCGGNGDDQEPERDYRQDMRNFVQGISAYARGIRPDFLVIPQNGHQLISQYKDTLVPAQTYLSAIDGVGREDLFYGYEADNEPTPVSESAKMMPYLDLAEANGVQVLVTDYCWTHSYVDDSYAQNAARGYISFAADHRDLDDIPPYPQTPHNVNVFDIPSLAVAKNFLYLLNPWAFGLKSSYLNALQGTNHDIVIIDLFYEDSGALTSSEILDLKSKANGGNRLLLAYMCIGEAEDYRNYWDPSWKTNPPSWLLEENPDWPGNYKVRYWDPAWQKIIYRNDDSYLKKILDAGFDGVYLDLIDAFEYFENGNAAFQWADSKDNPLNALSSPALPTLQPPSRAAALALQEIQVDVPKEVVENFRLRLDEFLESASSEPYYQAEKAHPLIAGFKIHRIKKGSIIDRLGLKNGDIITEANGVKIDSLESALAVYRHALTTTQVELIVQRDGHKIIMKFRSI